MCNCAETYTLYNVSLEFQVVPVYISAVLVCMKALHRELRIETLSRLNKVVRYVGSND